MKFINKLFFLIIKLSNISFDTFFILFLFLQYNIKNLIFPYCICISAFQNCPYLKYVYFDIDTKLTAIPSYCFQNCVTLFTIKISKLIISLGDYSFYNCSSLGSIVLNKNTSLSISCFEKCYSLNSVVYSTT